MNDLYVRVYWPEIQDYMVHPRYKECYMCDSLDEEHEFIPVYMVPKDLYDEVMKKDYGQVYI